MMFAPRIVLFALSLASFVLIGCPAPTTEPASQKPATASEPESVASDDSPVRTLESLAPQIKEVQEDNRIPERIEIRFAEPVVAGPNVALTDATNVRIQPEVAGGWSFTDRSTLTFKPQVGLRPSTEYIVVLKSVQQAGDTRAIYGKRSFQRVFTTPALEMRRLELTRWSPSEGLAEFSVVFSGAVRVSNLNSALAWTVDGIRRRIPIRRGPRPHVWTASLRDRGLKAGSIIEASVNSARVTSAVDFNITARGSAQVNLPKDKALFVRGVAVVEGADGFFVRVVCHDEASKGRAINFWDRQLRQSFRLSPRCVLGEESAKAKLRFEPAVDFKLSPTRGGFRIHAPFARGTVQLILESGARSVDGAVTASRYTRALTIPARRAKLEFVAQGRYLPPSAWGSLALRHQNVAKVDLNIRHVTKDNIVRWLSDSGEGTGYANSDLIVSQKIDLTGAPDALKTTSLAIQSYLAKPPPGLVEIQVVDADAKRAKSTVRFAMTNLNVLAKRQDDGRVRAWVLTAHDHRPVAGADVELVVYSGRKVSTCRTDAEGGCSLTGVGKDAVDQTRPFALLARTADDFTFIRFDQLRLDTSGYDVHGRGSTSATPYRAAIYSDRGVYRPGDTAHVGAILRAEDNRAPAAGMPVMVELVDPKRKVSRRRALKTNAAGMVTIDFPFADYADTGRYQAVFRAGKRVVGRYAFSVEEFVPERMEVVAKPSATDYGAQQDADIDVSARYLFGGTAAGSRYELRCELAPTRFKPKQHPGYSFDVWRDQAARAVELGQVSGTLAAEGKGRLTCPSLTGRGRLLSTARLRARVAVFESGSGRTTQGQTTALVHPSELYIGLKSDTRRVERDRSFTVQGVVVGWDGDVVKDKVSQVQLELLKVEREYGWVYDDFEGRWSNRRHAHLVSTQKIDVAVKQGRFSVALKTPETASSYVVRARAGDLLGDLKLGGTYGYWWYGYGYGHGGGDATPRPLKPETLPIAGPTETAVGDTVEVSLRAPYAGRVLWTVESDRVIQSFWQDVEAGPVEWSFKVDAFEPNVYVGALLLKDPHEESAASFLPARAYGVRNIRIRPEKFLQAAQIRAPDEVRSNQRLEIEVDFPKAERPMFVTVAAVDEGILSLTKFDTPDPAQAIFQRRRLGVTTFETIGWNVNLPAGDLGRSTGGGGPSAPGRIQMVKPVALWSGLVKVPDSGPLKVGFDLPQYRGKLRLMVVGAGPERLVSAARSVLVRDPIVLQTTLPRFLVQGDEAQIPVFLTNLSGRDQKVAVRLTSEAVERFDAKTQPGKPAPLVKVRGPAVRQVDLKKDAQATIVFRLDAKATVGAARLKVEAKAPNITVSETLDVPFSPNAPRTKTVQRIALKAGDVDLKPYLKGWLPTTESTTFWVTANPYGAALDHLGYLVRYPYGCVEQTTSATRPLLFLGGLARNVDPGRFGRVKLEDAVAQGIDRVLGMQTASGGFGYWPGASRPVYWGTAYATHMLLDAKKQGFDVPQARIDEALTWMNRALTTSDDRFQSYTARPYMHYVMAVGGRGAKAQMLDLLNELSNPTPEIRRRLPNQRQLDEMALLLRSGLYLAGDQRFKAQLLAPDISPIQNDRSNGWSFYSDRRRRAMSLAVLTDIFGPAAELQPLAQLVSTGLTGRSSYWYTTQELAWGITGLGKTLGKVTKAFTSPALVANGQAVAPQWTPAKKDDLGDRSFSLYRASEYKSLVLKGKHKAADKVYLVVSSDGVKAGGSWKTGGQHLWVERRYRDERGDIIDFKKPLQLGDLVYVELTISNRTAETIQNVAVVDRFAAAMEIENPRLGRDVRTDWLDHSKRWRPEHMNLRDDRVEAFGALRPGRSVKLVYLLRAVSAGAFTVPPVEVEAMYDPSRWSRQQGPRIQVRGPWDGR